MTGKNTLITGLIAGAALGAAAGLLMAPKPGNVTRRYLANQAGRLRQRIQQGKNDEMAVSNGRLHTIS
jgi:gas vesicle protein